MLDKKRRQEIAQNRGIIANVGKTVKADKSFAFRSGETAKIIGWGINPEDESPMYFIKFDDGECHWIRAGELFEASGYVFVD